MGPFASTNQEVGQILRSWFDSADDLLVERYKPHSGGGGYWFVVQAYAAIEDLIMRADSGMVIFVLQDQPYPIRGIANDKLIAEALDDYEEGQTWTIVKPGFYPTEFESLEDAETWEGLRQVLEQWRGSEIWVGKDQEMPGHYWEKNEQKDALIIIKE